MSQYPGTDTPKSPVRGRRQSLAAECTRADVVDAVARTTSPDGKRKIYAGRVVWASRQVQALAAFDAITHPSLARKRADGRATAHQLWRILVWGADRDVERRRKQLLVSIPLAVLMERLGKSRRTVQYTLRLFEQVGILKVVREGTTDEYQAPGRAEGNVVPVYVLTIPLEVLPDVPGGPALLAALQDRSAPASSPDAFSPASVAGDAPERRTAALRHSPIPGESSARGRLRAVDQADVFALVSGPVDIDCTPSLSPVRETKLTSAGARESRNPNAEPLRGTPIEGASRRGPWAPAGRQGSRWLAHETPARRTEQLAAADELRSRVLALRPMSDRAVRSVAREFFVAGWNVLDIVHALEWRADGTRWTLDSIPWTGEHHPAEREELARRAAAWLTYRLRHWRADAGTVRRSRHQQLAAEKAERAAHRRAEREAARRRPLGDSSARAEVLAAARDLAARRRAERDRARTPWMPQDLR
uniref:hypothetical protein n=1 Tax=Promicromonospora sp. CA-289581 TaxID=3240013 RepID=UPI003F490E32